MGNCVDCGAKTGDDLVICTFGVSNIDEAKQAYQNYFPAEYKDKAWATQLAYNQGQKNPESSWIAITPETYNKGQSYYCQEWLSCLPENWGDIIDWKPESANAMDLNVLALAAFLAGRDRLQALSSPVPWLEVMPEIYHLYNTAIGKEQVEKFISDHADLPAACAEVLRHNYLGVNQIKYGLLNPPAIPIMTGMGYANGQMRNVDFSTAYNMIGLSTLSSAVTYWAKGKIFGDPFWTFEEQQAVYRAIIGDYKDGDSFLAKWAQAYVDIGFVDPGKTPIQYLDPEQHAGMANPITTPGYTGDLPYLPKWAETSTTYHLATTDPNSYGYVDPCNKESVDSLLPAVGGILAGGLMAVFIPGSKSKFFAAITFGTATFELLTASTGWKMLQYYEEGVTPSNKHYAAQILAVGMPITFIQMMIDIGLTPSFMQTPYQQHITMALGVAGGLIIIEPILAVTLDVTGDIMLWLTSPIALISHGLQWAFGGCAAHAVVWGFTCDCENASTKPGLADALVGPIYGCTGEQYKMRHDAMMAAMTNGVWGTDPFGMGQCDDKGHMDNLVSCISAGEWAYGTWPDAFGTTPQKYLDEIQHVLDIKNRSFLPPLDTDKPCLQYGEHFRLQPGGSCADTRAPVGMQGPGQFQWPDSPAAQTSSECIIL